MKALKTMRDTVVRAALISAVSLGLVPQAGAQTAAEGQREGITVHGRWTVDVRNPDGTLAQHQEFENGLIDSGLHLAWLLGRLNTTGYWLVSAFDRQTSPCQNGTYAVFPNDCLMVEAAGTGVAGTNVFQTLTVSNTGFNNSQIVLRGTATALTAGRVSEVYTNFGLCPATVGAGGCGRLQEALPFTGTSLPTAIPVASGQIIQVTVVISFS
jgi:hypothetical protein